MTDSGDLPSGDPDNDRPSYPDSGFDWRRILFDRDSFFPVLLLAIATILVSPIVDGSAFGYVIVFPVTAVLVVLALDRSRIRHRTAGSRRFTGPCRHWRITASSST